MKTGAELIAEERQRQIEQEGYSATWDAEHKPGALTAAAICYAVMAGSSPAMRYEIRRHMSLFYAAPRGWPWSPEHWKPGQNDSNAARIRELTKAGALLAAEIDRLQREQANASP